MRYGVKLALVVAVMVAWCALPAAGIIVGLWMSPSWSGSYVDYDLPAWAPYAGAALATKQLVRGPPEDLRFLEAPPQGAGAWP